MQKYFLQQEYTPSYINRNFLKYRYKLPQPFVISSKGNHIKLYKLHHDGLSLFSRHTLQAEIVKLQVLQSSFHSSDFVWILDHLGRFCCWRPDQGQQFAYNVVKEESNCDEYGQHQEQGDMNNQVFSGVNYHYQQGNINTTIFYSMKTTISIIHLVITKQGIHMDSSNIIHYDLPNCPIRDIKWLKHYKQYFLLGLIIQDQLKTRLEIYDLELGYGLSDQALHYKLEKVNLLSFYSEVPGQILILTYNQISLYIYKTNQVIKSFRTRGNYGQGFSLGCGLYGQIGQQLTIFSRNELKPYGKIPWDDDKLLKQSGLTNVSILHSNANTNDNSDLRVMMSVTNYDQIVYIMLIHHNQVDIIQKFNHTLGYIRKMDYLPSLTHNLTLTRSNYDWDCEEGSNLILTSTARNNANGSSYNITKVQPHLLCLPIQTQQQFPFIIQSIFSISEGIYLLLHCIQSNLIFRLNKLTSKYNYYFSVPQGSILKAQSRFIIYQSMILQIDYQSNKHWVLKQDTIILAQINSSNDYIYYLNTQGQLYGYDYDSDRQILLAGSGSVRRSDYCWGMIQRSNMLICANLDQMDRLILVNGRSNDCSDDGDDSMREMAIKGHTLIHEITSMATAKGRQHLKLPQHLKEIILIGYIDGSIHLHQQSSSSTIVHIFNHLSSSPINFIPISSSQLIISTQKSKYFYYQYDKNRFEQCKQLSIGGEKMVGEVVYVGKINRMLVIELENQYVGRHHHHNYVKMFDLGMLFSQKQQKSQLATTSSCSSIYQTTPLSSSATSSSLPIQNNKDHNNHKQPFVIPISHTSIIIIQPLYAKQLNSLSSTLTKIYKHPLVNVIDCIAVQIGIVFCGRDCNQTEMIVVLSEALEPIAIIPFKESLEIRELKSLSSHLNHHVHSSSNQFFMRTTTSLTLQHLSPQHQLKQLMGINILQHIQAIDINNNNKQILIHDPYRALSLYQYQVNITFLGKYVPGFQIVLCKLMDECILVGDRRGMMYVLGVQIEKGVAENRVKFSKVCQINLNFRMVAICNYDEKGVFFALENGKVCSLKIIDKQTFYALRSSESKSQNSKWTRDAKSLSSLKNRSSSMRFNYYQWRQPSSKTKLIDSQILQSNHLRRMVHQNGN